MSATLYFGDNLHVLKKYIKDETVDLIYLDPPFNSNADYNLLFRTQSGSGNRAQIQAFDDTWTWGEEAEQALDDIIAAGGRCSIVIQALRDVLGANDMTAYLVMMTIRLIDLHRVLKSTGSLYLHCDPTASHYLKMILDVIFGPTKFRSEIVWKRTTAHSGARRYSPVHDVLLFYTKTDQFTWNAPRVEYEDEYLDKYYKYDDGDGRRYWRADITGAGVRTGDSGKPWRDRDPTSISRHWALPQKVVADLVGQDRSKSMSAQEKLDILDAASRIYWPKGGGMPQYKRYREELKGLTLSDLWTDIDRINPVGRERVGYPTQKPVALLDRILRASSNEGDVILDPFCGCGTAVAAAEKLGRSWIGIDITHLAIHVIADRLDRDVPHARYNIIGQPTDLAGAEKLADIDKYQFQWWATWLCGGQPFGGERKGRDRGIDGTLEFVSRRGQHDWGIISVKGGKQIGPSMVRDLAGTVAREKASLGVFICLTEPTKEMEREAVLAGFVELGGVKYRKIQLRTIAQLLAGAGIDSPYLLTTTQEAPATVKLPKKAKKYAIAPAELQKQRSFMLVIPGGRKDDAQQTLPLGDPLLTQQTEKPKTRRRA